MQFSKTMEMAVDGMTQSLSEETRQQPYSQFQGLLDQLSEGVLVTDLTGTVLWANRAALHLTGWTAGELQGMPLREMISIKGLKETLRVWGVGDDQARGRYRAFLQTRSGERREVLLSVGRTARLGAPTKLFLVRDGRGQTQRESRLPQQMGERKERESLACETSVIIHDLRNFVSTLLMTVDNLGSYRNHSTLSPEGLRTLKEIADKIRCLVEKLA